MEPEKRAGKRTSSHHLLEDQLTSSMTGQFPRRGVVLVLGMWYVVFGIWYLMSRNMLAVKWLHTPLGLLIVVSYCTLQYSTMCQRWWTPQEPLMMHQPCLRYSFLSYISMEAIPSENSFLCQYSNRVKLAGRPPKLPPFRSVQHQIQPKLRAALLFLIFLALQCRFCI